MPRRSPRRQHLSVQLRIARGPAMPLWRVLQALIDGVEEGDFGLPPIPRGARVKAWDIRLRWQNAAGQDWREGQWGEVMQDSSGRGGWDDLILGYLRGQLAQALEQGRDRAEELEREWRRRDEALRRDPAFARLSDPVQAAQRATLRREYQERIRRVKPPEG